jgi:hypothetical protein
MARRWSACGAFDLAFGEALRKEHVSREIDSLYP